MNNKELADSIDQRPLLSEQSFMDGMFIGILAHERTAVVAALRAALSEIATPMLETFDGPAPAILVTAQQAMRCIKPDDHACARCVPHSEILIDGFVCAYHRAEDALKNAAPVSQMIHDAGGDMEKVHERLAAESVPGGLPPAGASSEPDAALTAAAQPCVAVPLSDIEWIISQYDPATVSVSQAADLGYAAYSHAKKWLADVRQFERSKP
jgi:hypothetical protein